MDPDQDSDREDEPVDLLTTWLGELDHLKQGLELDSGCGWDRLGPGGGSSSYKGNTRQEYRCSLINLEGGNYPHAGQDQELDDILGELSQLETQFSREIKEQTKKNSSSDKPGLTCDQSQKLQQLESGSSVDFNKTNQRPGGDSRNCSPEIDSTDSRNRSPDNDSAFCDNLSGVSSSSSARTDQSKTSSGMSSSLVPTSREDHQAKIKAEKIKIAIEKIKEASVKKLFIKVFTSDGSAKSLLVDEKMTVASVTRILAEKNHVTLDPKWALVELVPDLYMERVYEDHEMLVENCLLWKLDSKNTLWFIERPEKYDLFVRPETYLLGTCSSQIDNPMEEHSRQELVEEYFLSTGVGAPQVEGQVWLKADNKKTWKKCHFILRSSGLYYSTKGKKHSKDLVCLSTFDVNQVYYGVGWKRKFKAPSDFCFGIKHPQIQSKNPKYIKYLCVDSQKELHQWVTGIRIAKNGRHLYDNYRGLVEEITHADIDILTSKRGSVNSAACLVTQTKAESCAGKLAVNASPVNTPGSENKSFDSGVSTGIKSEYFAENFPTNEILKFDKKINNSEFSINSLNLTMSRKPSICKSVSSDKSNGTEHGFESDHPEGGTIKKRPPLSMKSSFVNSHGGFNIKTDKDSDNVYNGNIRLGAGGTLLNKSANSLNRTNSEPPTGTLRCRSSSEDRSSGTLGRSHSSKERLTQTLERKSSREREQAKQSTTSQNNYEELQLLLDELHTNVRQAKDIQAKINNTMMSYDDIDQLPPPPPPRTSSRLSLSDELLPLPPPQMALTFPSKPETPPKPVMDSQRIYRTRNLPPIAPKPTIIASLPPKNSYGTLPNPGKSASKIQRSKSGRRISFDNNIQLIDDPSSASGEIPAQKLSPYRGVASSEHMTPYGGSVSTPIENVSLGFGAYSSEPLYTAVLKPNGKMSRYPATGITGMTGSTGAMGAMPSSGPGATLGKVCCVSQPSQSSSPGQSSYDIYSSLQHQPLEHPATAAPSSFQHQPSHSSVPSSPVQNSRLWGSFRGKKPPPIDKRIFSPYLKTLS